MTKVVNIRREAYDIYIGRPRANQPWGFGNPFRVGRDGARGECAAHFEEWLVTGVSRSCSDATPERRKWIIENLHQLRGKTLGCFCKPNSCHGDILASYADDPSGLN